MPVFTATELQQIGFHVFRALGASEEEARIVSDHLVMGNLTGHDSHGVMLILNYVETIRKGELKPGAPIEVVRETPSTALINGNWGFGQVVAEEAMRLAIAKARSQAISAVGIQNIYHVGRLADYPLMAVKEGMIGIMMANGCGGAQSTAPWGGIARRFATNPLCIAVPSGLEGPIFLDMATSVAAVGKLYIKKFRHEKIPEGWIIDAEGNPATDPQAFFGPPEGAVLPLGGVAGHKGYGLAFLVDVLAGILTGAGHSRENMTRWGNGTFIIVINTEVFRPLEEFRVATQDLTRYIKSSPLASGFHEILYPGEIEWRREQQGRQDGIFVEDETWKALASLIRELKIKSRL
ncbi:MAG: Ldh family oxidoreductase, partial [Nitrospinota bacterium]